MSDEKKNVLKSLNDAFLDFSEQVFGKSGKDFLESTQNQINEFNVSAIRSFVEFTDQMIEDTKLKDNELVQKSHSTVKDLLRQFGVLEEESEDEF